MNILWTKIPPQNSLIEIADINGHRLCVRRVGAYRREFEGLIDGKRVGEWTHVEMAKSQTAKIFRQKTNEETAA